MTNYGPDEIWIYTSFERSLLTLDQQYQSYGIYNYIQKWYPLPKFGGLSILYFAPLGYTLTMVSISPQMSENATTIVTVGDPDDGNFAIPSQPLRR